MTASERVLAWICDAIAAALIAEVAVRAKVDAMFGRWS